MTRKAALPPGLTPRCLTAEQSAAYLGVSLDVFRAEVNTGLWPKGTARGAKGGKLTWDIRALDLVLDRMSGLTNDPIPVIEATTDLWEQRLNAALDAKRIKNGQKAPRQR